MSRIDGTVTDATITGALQDLRDRILVAITRLQSDDPHGAIEELEAAAHHLRTTIEELRT